MATAWMRLSMRNSWGEEVACASRKRLRTLRLRHKDGYPAGICHAAGAVPRHGIYSTSTTSYGSSRANPVLLDIRTSTNLHLENYV